MSEIKKKDGIIQISLFWPDLTETAQNEIREALDLGPDDDNNWTYIPMTMMEIQDDSEEEYVQCSDCECVEEGKCKRHGWRVTGNIGCCDGKRR